MYYWLLVVFGGIAFALGRFRRPETTTFAVWDRPPALVRLAAGAPGGKLLWDVALAELAGAIAALVGVLGLLGVFPPWIRGLPTPAFAVMLSVYALMFATLVIAFVRFAKKR